jgi:hypothetical protein
MQKYKGVTSLILSHFHEVHFQKGNLICFSTKLIHVSLDRLSPIDIQGNERKSLAPPEMYCPD